MGAFYYVKNYIGGNEMYYYLSFFGGVILCLVIMIQFIKAKEVKELD
ncbi:hypothetical protein BwiPL1_20800 [Bacillus wiedmannii]|nr:hypothetical protein BwiPL1_20800 [Bacillus wiedmannii]